MHEDARLDQFDKDEVRLIARKLRPDLDDDEFDEVWAGHFRMDDDHQRRLELN